MLETVLEPGISHVTWFQQDGTTSHIVQMSMEKLRKMFLHLISQFGDLNWLPRSPNLSACDCLLWGYLKSRILSTWPTTLGMNSRLNIREAVQAIPHDMLHCVMDDFTMHHQECITGEEGHLLQSFFKK
jgi:hypothetical protein